MPFILFYFLRTSPCKRKKKQTLCRQCFTEQFFKLMQFNYYINLMAIFPYFNHVKCASNNELLMLSLLSLRGIFRAAAYLLDHKAA